MSTFPLFVGSWVDTHIAAWARSLGFTHVGCDRGHRRYWLGGWRFDVRVPERIARRAYLGTWLP